MQALLPKLAEMVKDEYNLHRGVKEGIKYVQKELESMQAALEKVSDALPDQLDPQVKLWARDLREMSYDIEDTIDSYGVRVDAGDESESSKSCCTIIKAMLPRTSRAGRNIATEIERIKREVDELSKRRDRCKVDSIAAPHKSDRRWLARYEDEQKLVGIDHLREMVIELLSMEGQGPSEQKLKLVSIFGPGGMGKTTLASAVYKKLEEKFDCAAFVSVSLNPNIKDIITSILRQVRHQKYENAPVDHEKDDTDSIKHVPKAKKRRINRQDSERNYEAWSESEVMDEIIDVLKDKRYLIVIDDIWDESAWDHIKCVFKENNCGSKMITTTRNKRLAEYACSSDIVDGIIHELQPLSEIDSRKLFYYKVFRQDMCPPEFKHVSQKILGRCGGWPIAIVTVASLLTNKRPDQWHSVYNSIHTGLESSRGVKDMRGILSLSYYDLPHELKTCLLYLSMFPEDSIIGRDELIWRWAAEGFIHATQEENLYEIGEGYFNELINRSMIQQAHVDTHGRAQACRVHDLVLEFITKLSTEENFVTTLNRLRLPSQPNSIRRLSLRNCRDEHGVPQNITSLPHVRSLVVFSEAFESIPSLSNFRVLRVLDLELWSSNGIKGVGKLLLLRYFRLSHKYFEYIELPEEIGNLQFLQTLDLKGARIEQLPSTVAKIRGLRVLEVSLGEWGKTHEKSLLECLCNLEKLQALYIFAPDVSLDFMLDVSWARRYLRRFTACVRPQTEHILRPSSLWEEFSPFSRLPGWIDSSLSNLSDLSIIVKILQRQGLETLAHLPLLLSLDLQVVEATKERLAITGSTYQAIFPYLANFKYASRAMGLVFRRGAMQRLGRLSLSFDVAETKDVHGDFDFGLENLTSLKAVDVGIDCRCARDWEVMAAEAALSNATNSNPNHPTLNVSRHFEREMLWDGKQEIPEGTIRKQEEIRLTKIGPWGGNGGRARDIEVAPRRLESVKIWSGWVINSLEFSYSDHDGQQHTAGPWGRPVEDMSQIQLGPSEFVTQVSGTVGPLGPLSSILTSVTFHTNVKSYGPFGRLGGTPFATSVKNNGSAIVGFFGRAGANVDALGVYVRPV